MLTEPQLEQNEHLFVSLGAVTKNEQIKEWVWAIGTLNWDKVDKPPGGKWTREQIFLFRYYHVHSKKAKEQLEKISSFGEMIKYAKDFDFDFVRSWGEYWLPLSIITEDENAQMWLLALERELELSKDEIFSLRSEFANRRLRFNSTEGIPTTLLLENIKQKAITIINMYREGKL